MKKLEWWSESKQKKQELKALYSEAEKLDKNSEEYEKILKHIEDLHRTDKKKIDPNTVLIGIFSFIGPVALVLYEGKGNIVHNWKVLNLLPKPKF